jgi:hypothetical protein
MLGPALTGLVLERTGNFFWPFAIAAVFCFLGSLFYSVVLRKVEQVSWGAATTWTGDN